MKNTSGVERGHQIFAILVMAVVMAAAGHFSNQECPEHRDNGQLVARCSHLGLTSLPLTWSNDVTSLDVSYNDISVLRNNTSRWPYKVRHLSLSHNTVGKLDQHALTLWTQLESLDLSYNQLTAIADGSFENMTQLKTLNLHQNRLLLQSHVFKGLSQLRYLDLSCNLMTVLMNDTFSALGQLRWLNINSNQLQQLQSGSMAGLGNLTYLDLNTNKLQLTSSVYPAHVFASLVSLEEIHLEYNDNNNIGDYPIGVFGDLVSLRFLAIDTFVNTRFGSDFAGLQMIEMIHLGHHCKIKYLSNDSFEGFRFSSLKHIFLEGCPLLAIDVCAFCHLPSLHVLKIQTCSFLKPNVALRALYGLQGNNMTNLILRGMGIKFRTNYILKKRSFQYLRNICVSEFIMESSHIANIPSKSLGTRSLFLRCIQHINLARNNLVGDGNIIFQTLIYASRLRTMQLQGQYVFNTEDMVYRLDRNHNPLAMKRLNNITAIIPTPSRLELLNFSSVFFHINPLPTYVVFKSGNRLRALDLSFTNMGNCRSTLIGLDRLEVLKLNNNKCYSISCTLFDKLPNLQHLQLSNFGINPSFYPANGTRLFQNLLHLKSLDLSSNQLLDVDPDMLHAQRDLRELSLAWNRFRVLPVALKWHANLQLLDLSHNMVTTLTSTDRERLDHLATRHPISLKLYANPLTCTCANLDMVQWLWHTSVTLDGVGPDAKYPCILETGMTTDTETFMADFLSHWRSCVGPRMFGLALGLFLTQMLVLVLVYVICRTWTHLCYIWKAIRRHRLPNRLTDFQKDVYFVYSDTNRDVLWVCGQLVRLLHQHQPDLRILLRSRDEVVGAWKAESITQHIEVSWKTLLVVTRDLAEDDWAWFAIKQAARHMTDRTPERVVILFLEDVGQVPAFNALKVLLSLVPDSCVFHARRNTAYDHLVWAALVDCIIGDR